MKDLKLLGNTVYRFTLAAQKEGRLCGTDQP